MTDRNAAEQLEFEARLSREMTRVPGPEGFADRVMDRVAANAAANERGGRLAVMPQRGRWLAIAAMLLLSVLLGGWQRRASEVRREREQATTIQRQFDLAMQVTQRTLAEVQTRIGHAGQLRPAAETQRPVTARTTRVQQKKEVQQ